MNTSAKGREFASESGLYLKSQLESYAETLILVTLIVVNFFSFFVIKSSHGSYEGCH